MGEERERLTVSPRAGYIPLENIVTRLFYVPCSYAGPVLHIPGRHNKVAVVKLHGFYVKNRLLSRIQIYICVLGESDICEAADMRERLKAADGPRTDAWRILPPARFPRSKPRFPRWGTCKIDSLACSATDSVLHDPDGRLQRGSY